MKEPHPQIADNFPLVIPSKAKILGSSRARRKPGFSSHTLLGMTTERIIKNTCCVCLAVFVALVMALYAAEPVRSGSHVQGTVVRVEKHKVYSPDSTSGGSNPSDAPLTSRFYAYEVSVRVDCETYVGRYETPFNYLPSAFTPDQSIQVRVTKRVMYFDLPNDPDVRMGIVRRRSECSR